MDGRLPGLWRGRSWSAPSTADALRSYPTSSACSSKGASRKRLQRRSARRPIAAFANDVAQAAHFVTAPGPRRALPASASLSQCFQASLLRKVCVSCKLCTFASPIPIVSPCLLRKSPRHERGQLTFREARALSGSRRLRSVGLATIRLSRLYSFARSEIRQCWGYSRGKRQGHPLSKQMIALMAAWSHDRGY